MGTGVPALFVCWIPLKLNDNLGSSSESKLSNLGNGNNISLTPCKTKAPPKPTTALVILPAAAKDPGETIGLKN